MSDEEVFYQDPGRRIKGRSVVNQIARSDPSKAAVTNDIFTLVRCSWSGKEARRWRDLIVYYANRVSVVRFYDEEVRVRILLIVNLTIQLERMTDAVVAGADGRLLEKSGPPSKRVHTYRQGSPETMITIANTITSLLKSLNIEDDEGGYEGGYRP